MYDVITKTEGFTKPFKFLERLFDELGPIYKEDFTMRPSTTVHVIDPEDFEKTFRAEGKYPQRPILDFHLEHRRRRNYFPGVPNLQGEEWHRVRQTIAPKIMRPKVVEENIGNFNAVSKDAVASLVKKACEQDDHMPDLEKELYRWSLEGMATFAFDTRLGLYEDPPPQEALEFTEAIINFFEISQQLLFDAFYQIASKYIDTPLF
ncbi:unnamed protein product [Porites evermanni]|uniref:Cytochrome P450 n=1 Tax=Porites evermanni TaxID=104178 RepID=A0ABN8R8P2_9CNID|nr:unnamed protein product [Porites evermanni]